MRNSIAIILCVLLITSCVSRKKKAAHFDYKNFKTSYAKLNDSLYASVTEVSNGEYRAFLNHLKESDMSNYNTYNIDSNAWRKKLGYGEPLIKYYHKHPAYKDYPVANVSYEGTTAYCKWLTDNYNKNPKREFKKVVFRLPTETEWKLAASGGKSSMIYPWGGPYIRNSKGSYLANFRTINESDARDTIINGEKLVISSPVKTDYGHWSVIDNGIVTTPVKSYFPNDLGIYNMAGNVSEMLAEKGKTKGGSWSSYGYYLRIDAPDEFGAKMFEPSPLVGFRVFVEIIEK